MKAIARYLAALIVAAIIGKLAGALATQFAIGMDFTPDTGALLVGATVLGVALLAFALVLCVLRRRTPRNAS